MKLTVLGCTGGIGGERRTMSLLLDEDVLIDAGSGVGDLSLERMARIDHVFLTHSHLDHSAFVPLLADAAAFLRERPLLVHGLPATLSALKTHMLNGVMWPDYSVKPSPEQPYIRLVPLEVGQEVELAGRRITGLPARHAVPALAYRIDSGAASFVYSGDTTYCEAFWDALNGIPNLAFLMVETTFLCSNRQGAAESGHMTAELLARGLARLTRPVRLLIAHMEPGKEDRTMAEVTEAVGAFHPVRLERGDTVVF